uniref:Uncharacterized protein n=1 Tax=Leptospirillum ferrodiazotrophum TaxID=412449 RepID=C6I086_9BACT|nr:MAG: hypothetical protein UBAL3_95530046 [Leptospirillum ferrodiazotrophum]
MFREDPVVRAGDPGFSWRRVPVGPRPSPGFRDPPVGEGGCSGEDPVVCAGDPGFSWRRVSVGPRPSPRFRDPPVGEGGCSGRILSGREGVPGGSCCSRRGSGVLLAARAGRSSSLPRVPGSSCRGGRVFREDPVVRAGDPGFSWRRVPVGPRPSPGFRDPPGGEGGCSGEDPVVRAGDPGFSWRRVPVGPRPSPGFRDPPVGEGGCSGRILLFAPGIRGSPGGACRSVLVPPPGSGILLVGREGVPGRILLFAPGIRGSPGGADSAPLTFPCDTGFSLLRGRIGERCYGRKTLRSTLAGHRLSSPENPFAPPRCQGPFFSENPRSKPGSGLLGVTVKASRRILLFGRF